MPDPVEDSPESYGPLVRVPLREILKAAIFISGEGGDTADLPWIKELCSLNEEWIRWYPDQGTLRRGESEAPQEPVLRTPG